MNAPHVASRHGRIAAALPIMLAVAIAIAVPQMLHNVSHTRPLPGAKLTTSGAPRPGFIVWNNTIESPIVFGLNYLWYDNVSAIYTSSTATIADVRVNKWSEDGEYIWTRTWDGGGTDHCTAIHGDTDGNVYVCGETDSFGIGDTDLLLLKYAANGTLLWSRTWGSHAHITYDETGVDVVCDPQGNVYTCGSMVPSPGANDDMLLVKWASNGTQLWNKTFGGTSHETGAAMTLTPDNEIYFFGKYWQPSPTYFYTVVTKWSAGGSLLLSRTDVYDEFLEGALKIANSTSLYSIATKEVSIDSWDIDVTRWNADGTRQRHTIWGYSSIDDRDGDILGRMDGSAVVSGYTEQPSPVYGRGFLFKMNRDGEVIWNVTWAEYGIVGIGNLYNFDKDCVLATYRCTYMYLALINITAIDAQFLDSDNDTITDYDEVYVHGSSPNTPDTDGDGYGDWSEVFVYGTDPALADTDGDGATDPEEVNGGTDPFDPSDNPQRRTAALVALWVGIPASIAAGAWAIVAVRKKLPAVKQKRPRVTTTKPVKTRPPAVASCPGCNPSLAVKDGARNLCKVCEAALDGDERALLRSARKRPAEAQPDAMRAVTAAIPSQIVAAVASRKSGGAPVLVNFVFDAKTSSPNGQDRVPAAVVVSAKAMDVFSEDRHVSIPFDQLASVDVGQNELVLVGKPPAKAGGQPRELRILAWDAVLGADLIARRLRLHVGRARAA